MSTIPFTLISPDKVLLDRPVSMVVLPGMEGDIGVLPHHAPLLFLLRPGVVTVYEDDKIYVRIFVDGGYSEITSERCSAFVTEGTALEALDKATLELEVKNLIEDVADSQTAEERRVADRHLEVARAKLMEVITHQK